MSMSTNRVVFMTGPRRHGAQFVRWQVRETPSGRYAIEEVIEYIKELYRSESLSEAVAAAHELAAAQYDKEHSSESDPYQQLGESLAGIES